MLVRPPAPTTLLRARPRSRGARAAAAASPWSSACRRQILPPRSSATRERGRGEGGGRCGEQPPDIHCCRCAWREAAGGGGWPGSERGRRRRNRGGVAAAWNSRKPALRCCRCARRSRGRRQPSPCPALIHAEEGQEGSREEDPSTR
jgi:hypothetical protein